MALFDSLGKNSGQQQNPVQQMDPRSRQLMEQDVRDVKANPSAFLKNRGFSIPDGMNDAGQIARYLIQTGQIGAPKMQQVMRMFGK